MTPPCNIRFCKIIPGTSLAHGLLKLPGKFTAKCGDGMSNPVFLNLPDCTEWKIQWTKHDGEIWFQEGWKEFATRYSLDHGHMLFFEYVGISRFDVHICDKSAVEIDYRSHFTHDNPDNSVETLDEQFHDETDNIVQISDDSEQILDEQCIRKSGVKNTQSPSQPCKKMKNSITTDAGRSPNGVNLHQHDQSRSAGLQKQKFTKQKLEEEKGKSIFHGECPKVEQLTSSVLNRATSTSKSMHPSFKLVMRPSFINADYLVIPSEFSEQYLKKKTKAVVLEVMDGRSWPVILSGPRITAGWPNFASENNLKVDDVCVFELITKIQSLAFRVSIIPSAGKPSTPILHDHSKSRKVHPATTSRGGSSSVRTLVGKREEAREFSSENPFFMSTLSWQGNTTRCPVRFS
ncbi:B3 domain-containing transcription factor VRN1-like isoform X2 [Vigna unguiculata]|uniref:B3 domain-containing transcription factor VRN1-like isoform X2 n=1 Tax=Vigna unguiculata TaxID=3917 RepID=UPI0010161336|nr:B3 domain-containing transcription factor VRN1-like isoform X2 [Vigna unguiculata]